MRILHILPHLSKGGAERQFGYLAPELARMGHDVHVAYSVEGPQRPTIPGVMLHKLKSRSSYDPYLLWQLIFIIRRIKPDIIHTWIMQMDVLGGIAARITGVPWILREPSSGLGYHLTWKNRLRIRVGSWAGAIVSNSKGGGEYWATQLPSSRRYFIRNGVSVDEIDKTEAVLPTDFPWSEAPTVLFVGRLIELKNLASFFEALAFIKEKQPVSCVICGEGPQRAELELLRHRLGLDANVHFIGYLPAVAVWALIKKASVFVSLSAYEGCPNSVLEAMVSGCPLVVSDIPAHREILDEHCALFTDPSDIPQVADAIIQALQNTEASRIRALNARQKALEWTIGQMARKFEKVYYEVLDRHRR